MEHKCVAEACLEMKKMRGVELVYLRPDSKGDFDLCKARKSSSELREENSCVSDAC